MAGEPLLWWEETNRAHARSRKVAPGRPLTGLRVLDLTRVLAGPVATRFLAGFGAEVLRIDPPSWDEPAVVPEVVLGKRCARLDLRTPDGRARFLGLLREADVLVHGYRPNALARLGARRGNAPGNKARADRCLARRLRLDRTMVRPARVRQPRSDEQRHRRRGDAPFWKGSPDAPAGAGARSATGYLMAAAVVRGLTRRLTTDCGWAARTSLAKVAAFLSGAPGPSSGPFRPKEAERRGGRRSG